MVSVLADTYQLEPELELWITDSPEPPRCHLRAGRRRAGLPHGNRVRGGLARGEPW
jgi:hypothetical protein